jgi:hypothetical protein
MQETLKVIGAQESYFTGKLEAYLRAKGIPYQNVPFTMEELQQAAAHTGFFQIPQVACPDGINVIAIYAYAYIPDISLLIPGKNDQFWRKF